jgi:hypothetical protein
MIPYYIELLQTDGNNTVDPPMVFSVHTNSSILKLPIIITIKIPIILIISINPAVKTTSS